MDEPPADTHASSLSAPAPAATRRPAARQGAAESHTPEPLDIEKIRRELLEIARLVGSEEAGPTLQAEPDNKTIMIDLRLHDVLKLAPDAVKSTDLVETSPETLVSVIVPDLYEQMARGKVQTPLSNLLADVPPSHRSEYAQAHAGDLIAIPLPLVVEAVQPAELRKRTPAKEKDTGERLIPNLFNPADFAPTTAQIVLSVPQLPTPLPPAEEAVAKASGTEAVAETPADSVLETIAAGAAMTMQDVAGDAPVVPDEEVAEASVDAAPVEDSVDEAVTTHGLPREESHVVPPAATDDEVAEAQTREETVPDCAESVPSHVEGLLGFLSAAPAGLVETTKPAEDIPAETWTPEAQPAEAEIVELKPDRDEPEARLSPIQPVGPVPEPRASDEPMRSAVEAGAEPEQAIQAQIASEEIPLPSFLASTAHVMRNGIDLNQATAEELTGRLDGVGGRLAAQIVRYRTERGPFRDLFDLAYVPGMRRATFERVTGESWPREHVRWKATVDEIVGGQESQLPDVRQVALRFGQLPGFVGCLIAHEDGLLLAGSWDNNASDALGAFAPQMFKKVERYARRLKAGRVKSITLCLDDQSITLSQSGAIILVGLHEANRLTRKQVETVEAVAFELGRRLSPSS
jgi:competence ComEA-like helix-hairpin-helix protein